MTFDIAQGNNSEIEVVPEVQASEKFANENAIYVPVA